MTDDSDPADFEEKPKGGTATRVTARERFEADLEHRAQEVIARNRELDIRELEARAAADAAGRVKSEPKIDPITAAILGGAVTLITQIVTTGVTTYQQTSLETLRARQNVELETIKQQGNFVIEAIKTGGAEGQNSANARDNLRLLAKLQLVKVEADIDELLRDQEGTPLNIGLPASTPQPLAAEGPPDLELGDGYMLISGEITEAFDGDTVGFRPDAITGVHRLPGPPPRLRADGTLFVQLAGIDAPEVSAFGCESRGPQFEWALKARNALAKALGTQVDDSSPVVLAGEPAALSIGKKALLLTRKLDEIGRIKAYLYRDDQMQRISAASSVVRSGYKVLTLDELLIKESLNYVMVAEGYAARQNREETDFIEEFQASERNAVERTLGFWSSAELDSFNFTDAETFSSTVLVPPWLHRQICTLAWEGIAVSNWHSEMRDIFFSNFETGDPIGAEDLFSVDGSTVRMLIPPYNLAYPKAATQSASPLPE